MSMRWSGGLVTIGLRSAALFLAVSLGSATAASGQRVLSRFPTAGGRSEMPVRRVVAGLGPRDSWGTLADELKLDRRIIVRMKDSTAVQGEAIAIDSRTLTIREGAGTRVIQAADIARVGYATHRSRNAFWSGVGVGAAFGLYATLADKNHDPDGPVIGAIFFGLPIGGVASALLRDRALYQVKPAPEVTP